jgi:Importin beta binding domain
VPEPRPRNPTGQVPQPIPDPAQSQSHDELFGGVPTIDGPRSEEEDEDSLRDSNPTGPTPSTLAVRTEPLLVNDDTESKETKARGFKKRANPREHRRIRQEKQSELRKQARERILSELRGMPIGAGAMPGHETIDGWSEEEDDNLSDSEMSEESDGEQFQMNLGNNINDMIETVNEGQQILKDNGDY